MAAKVSLGIIPFSQAADLSAVGRMGNALASAGMSAAGQLFYGLGMLTNIVPLITVPRVAKARAANDTVGVHEAVGLG